MNLDFEYICETMGNLSGIPVRVYQGQEELCFFSMVSLPKDPMLIHKNEILAVDDKIGYFATPNLNYYGIFNIIDKKIIIGPTRLVPNTNQELREMAFLADVPQEDIPAFISAMKSIVGMPLERLVQMMYLMNYLINGEKLNLRQSIIFESQQESIYRNMVKNQTEQFVEEESFYHKVDNTFQTENTLLDIIAKGDIAAMEDWLNTPTTVQNGVIASHPIRQLKNTFISTVTLASRSAISGGMDAADAIRLANEYIYKAEMLSSAEDIFNLQFHVVKSFTQHVHSIKFGNSQSKLISDVAKYIQHNLSKAITTQEIADALFMSRPYLSKRFKEEAGITITDFIRKQKIEEAKRLLKYTDKSLLAISLYLGFSSQGHFTHTFKKYTQKNPSDYRQ